MSRENANLDRVVDPHLSNSLNIRKQLWLMGNITTEEYAQWLETELRSIIELKAVVFEENGGTCA